MDGQWVKVDDWLPIESDLVLIYTRDGGMYTAWMYRYGADRAIGWNINVDERYAPDTKDVTHWSRLPEPPKGE